MYTYVDVIFLVTLVDEVHELMISVCVDRATGQLQDCNVSDEQSDGHRSGE